ncbi:hypothetical protein [Tychonema sp. LEGE 07203]|nr:hypothetical protein [Tychonema sp. LEGE 07203]MBE9096742.1 hypothetical protein [Tychonema sp. LEGE 07203]
MSGNQTQIYSLNLVSDGKSSIRSTPIAVCQLEQIQPSNTARSNFQC